MKQPITYFTVLLLAVTGALATAYAAETPFNDAVALWHFTDGKDSAQAHHLTTNGAVTLGVQLTGEDLKDSLASGGDGKVARFSGGYLSLLTGNVQVGDGPWSLLVRIRDPQGRWLGPIFGSYGSEQQVSFVLRAVDGAALPFDDRNINGGELKTIAAALYGDERGPRAVRGSKAHLEFEWGAATPNQDIYDKLLHNLALYGNADKLGFPLEQEIKNGVMVIGFPLQVLGLTGWHDIVVRYTGPKLQLFADGVLLDEEYPIGTTRHSAAPTLFGARTVSNHVETGFSGEMDHAAVWQRALSDNEIAQLSGGTNAVAARRSAYLGDFPASRFQYYRTPSHNMKPGDSIPFFDGTRFNVFNCVVRRNQHSKWRGGHGAIELHHYSTSDLKTWRWDPVAVPITEQWESWNGTGGVAVHEGKWFMLHPCPTDIPEQAFGGVQMVTSKDGLVWEKQLPHPFLKGGDVDVVRNDEIGGYDLLKSGSIIPAPLPAFTNCTMVVWAEPSTNATGKGAVVSLVSGAAGKTAAAVYYHSDSRSWSLSTNAAPEQTPAGSGLHQLAVVKNGTRTTLYCDGRQADEIVSSKAALIPAGAKFVIGVRNPYDDSSLENYFTGQVADARLFNKPLTAAELSALQPGTASVPAALVWYDFSSNTAADRTGLVRFTDQVGNVQFKDGRLVLDGDSCVYGGARTKTIIRLQSTNLMTWTEAPGYVITADEEAGLTTCPHEFQWNGWWYYFGGNSVWRSSERSGPWLLQGRLDVLSVPKTGAFTGNRRISAGFAADGNWGGTIVLRELIQHPDGSLGLRWVPEMIPEAGEALSLPLTAISPAARVNGTAATIAAKAKQRAEASIANVPLNARISFTVKPQPGVESFGLRFRTDAQGITGTDLVFTPNQRTVAFTKKTDSAMEQGTSLSRLTKVTGLEKLLRIEVVFYHDLIDVEIDGRHALINRFWNPDGTAIRFWAQGGTVEFSDIKVCLLVNPPPVFPPKLK